MTGGVPEKPLLRLGCGCYLRTIVRLASLGLSLVCALVACEAESPTAGRAPTRAQALSPSEPAPPRLALLSTRPGSSETSLHFALPGAPGAAPAAVRFAHAPDGEVRGALVPGTERVVVVADMERRRDPSFGAWLLTVEPGREPKVLAKGCYHASRPLLLPTGRVLVQRGAPGPELPSAQRVDSLSVDELDPETGALRQIHTFQGYITHLAGLFDGEVLLYRVAPEAADLVAVDVESGAVRVLLSPIPALARDFSVDRSARSLVYTNHDGSGWLVERLSLDSGARQELARAGGMWITPSVWPSGGVLINDGRGAVVLGGAGPSRALGPGFDEVRSVSPDGLHVALLHRVPSSFAEAFVSSADGGRVTRVAAPAGARLEIAGFLP